MMSSSSGIPCREVFDDNSHPSAEEISEYALEIGIDPESESHLLPLARDGLMQPLPAPWKAFFDEKIQSHYYYNEETKKTQWEHPLDPIYKDLVKKARDASIQDDTYVSVQDLQTSEDNTKHLERLETKIESDEDLSMDSERDPKDNIQTKRLAPLGRPPLAPLRLLDKRLSDLKGSSLRKSIDSSFPLKSQKQMEATRYFDKGKLTKQQSEFIDLKIPVVDSTNEESFNLLLVDKTEGVARPKGLQLSGKGSMFSKVKKADLQSPDTEKSLPLDSFTKSDPPKGILRDKSDSFQKSESLSTRPKSTSSFEEDRKSVRFQLESTTVEPNKSPSSNSSSDLIDGQSSIISNATNPMPSNDINTDKESKSAPNTQNLSNIVLSPLVTRPPLPPKINPFDQLFNRETKIEPEVQNDKNSTDESPKRRLIRPPAADYIKPDLFQKNFQKISDLVRVSDIDSPPTSLEPPAEKEARPRSPMIPQANKISINLMESIESETSIDSPDKEFADFDLNDMNEKEDNEIDLDKHFVDAKYNTENRFRKSVPDMPEVIVLKVDDLKSYNSDSDEKNKNNVFKSSFASNLVKDTNISLHSKTSPKLEFDRSPKKFITRAPKLDTSIKSDSFSAKKDDVTSLSSSDKLNDRDGSLHSKLSLNLGNLDRSPKLDSPKSKTSKFDFAVKQRDNVSEDSRNNSREHSIDLQKGVETKSPATKLNSNNMYDIRSPKSESESQWPNKQGFKLNLNRPTNQQLKSSESSSSITRKMSSPRLDGVIISQGKSLNGESNDVVIMYQFEKVQDYTKTNEPKKELVAAPDIVNKPQNVSQKRDELSKELSGRIEEELKHNEELFKEEKRKRLMEQIEKQKAEMDYALEELKEKHSRALRETRNELQELYEKEIHITEAKFKEELEVIKEQFARKLAEQRKELEIENERALADIREQLKSDFINQRTKLIEENKKMIQELRNEQSARVTELKQDYRAEVERLRSQHSAHLEELRARLASERAASRRGGDQNLPEKYKCLKEKYARLKHDVKMSIERRNKRREISMTTGSETEKSNSNKANHSSDKCKEANQISVTAVIEQGPTRPKANNNLLKYTSNDNETSLSESNALKSFDNNNDDWKKRTDNSIVSPESSQTSGAKPRRVTVAFKEPLRKSRDRSDKDGATTDCPDTSDATTAEEKPRDSKETTSGHTRRRCFTRLKSASTSRLNYSPKRGENWSSPLESLRQQLRKLDDLEDQFPDLACQPNYSLRYPFTELGCVTEADTAELEFVRHRALVEREGIRRARLALRRRKTETRQDTQPNSEEREATELEVALHRARALLGEKEIRLRHIERALQRLAESQQPTVVIQETIPSDSSGSDIEAVSGSEEVAPNAVLRSLKALHADETIPSDSSGSDIEAVSGSEGVAPNAVLRSLKALHADVRDIWRALDARRPFTASPEPSSFQATSPQPRMSLSVQEPSRQDHSDGSVSERARSLKAWLKSAP